MLSLTLVLLAATAGNEDLEQAIAKTAKLDGYEFVTTTTRTGGGGFGGRGGRGGGEAPEPTPIAAKVGKGGVMFIRTGEVETYKQGTALVTRGEDGEWALQDMSRGGFGGRRGGDAQGGGGRRGAGDAEGGRAGGRRGGDAEGGEGGRRGGGDAEGGRGGGRRGGGDDAAGGRAGGRRGAEAGGDRRNLRAQMSLRGITPAHETLSNVVKHLENVKVEDKNGVKTYTADLTADGVAAMQSAGRGGRGRGGRGGGFGGDAESSGKAIIVVNKEGYVTSFDVETKTSMSTERGDFEFGSKQQCQLKNHGKVKVEVPEKIQKLLDSADEEIF